MHASFLLLALGGLGPTEPADPLELLLAEPAPPLAAPAALLRPLNDGDGSPFSYTYVEVGAVKYDVDDINREADIYYLEASLGLGIFHLVGSYQNNDLSLQDTTADLFSLGAGAHVSLTEGLDIFGDVSWLFQSVDSDISQWDDNTDGYFIRAGPRWMPIDWSGGGLEINGEALWIDLENRLASDDVAFGWGAGLRVHFLEFLSLGADYTKIEDDDQVGANARFSF